MLDEAVQAMRRLWQGGSQDHHGSYFTVEDARLYTLPDDPPPIMVAAGGSRATALAGRIGDGLISTAPKRHVVEAFDAAGGRGKPRYGKVTVCWASDEREARRIAHEWWPNTALPAQLTTELRIPAHFEQAAELVREEDVAEEVVCGPDPERHLDRIRSFADAGFDHVYVHQIGPDQEGFFRFYEREILPRVSR